MTDMTSSPDLQRVAFEVLGVRIGLETNDPRMLPGLGRLAPVQSRGCDYANTDHRFSVMTKDGVTFSVRYDVREGEAADEEDPRAWIASDANAELALESLDSIVQGSIALYAPKHIVISAAVVRHGGSAIVLPGKGLTGKSTLVGELIRAGATYYSDEFAPIDHQGLIHPYARPALRSIDTSDSPEPVAAGAIVFATYRPAGQWRPRHLSGGEAVLSVLAHTVPTQDRPQEAMQGVKRLLAGNPVVLQSERGEAADTAGALLAALEHAPAELSG
jgi:hypothetical protein